MEQFRKGDERLAAQYRKKPVVVTASRWFKNGDHPQDYVGDTHGFEHGELRTFTGDERKALGWEGSVVRYFRSPTRPGSALCEHCNDYMHIHGWIDTKEGGHIVCPGDWIITGSADERYPCKPDLFAEYYGPEADLRKVFVVIGEKGNVNERHLVCAYTTLEKADQTLKEIAEAGERNPLVSPYMTVEIELDPADWRETE